MYYLKGRERRMFIELRHWWTALRLARDAGWVPAGTRPSRPRSRRKTAWARWAEWCSEYRSGDGSLVLAEDAAAIAALRKVLPSIPDEERTPVADYKVIYLLSDQPPDPSTISAQKVAHDRAQVDPLEWASGDGKTKLAQLVEMCDDGEFYIW